MVHTRLESQALWALVSSVLGEPKLYRLHESSSSVSHQHNNRSAEEVWRQYRRSEDALAREPLADQL